MLRVSSFFFKAAFFPELSCGTALLSHGKPYYFYSYDSDYDF